MLLAFWGESASTGPRATSTLPATEAPLPDDLRAALRDICAVPVVDDGIVFNAEALVITPIRTGTTITRPSVHDSKPHSTVRGSECRSTSDLETPSIRRRSTPCYPVLLDAPRPRIRAYPREAVVAEKLHAMVAHGERNSRYKDFYDLQRARAALSTSTARASVAPLARPSSNARHPSRRSRRSP